MKLYLLIILISGASMVVLTAQPVLRVQAETDVNSGIEKRVEAIDQKQTSTERKLDREVRQIDHRLDELEENQLAVFGLILSGFFCALWAQFTRRSAWLWFFFGLFLAPIALVSLVWKNAVGLRSGELKYWIDR